MTIQFMNYSHLIPFHENVQITTTFTDIYILSISNSRLRILLLKVKFSLKDLYENSLVLAKFKSISSNQSN